MVADNSIVLIDCENLTAHRQREALGRWAGAARFELFGRRAAMAPWRAALARRGLSVAAEHPVPDDAPDQAADLLMAARATEAATGGTMVIIASNDKGFDALGPAVRRDGDLDELGLLRLIAAELAGPDGRAAGGGLGDHLRRRFGLETRGRLPGLAVRAGLTVKRDARGLWIGGPPDGAAASEGDDGP